MTTLFWDKNVPKTIPIALASLRPGIGIEYYLDHWPLSDYYKEGGDDIWLPFVGQRGWKVITRDWRLHLNPHELHAIKQHDVGVFYLWGAKEKKWEVMRCFARGYDRIVAAAENTPTPFIYRVDKWGFLKAIKIP